LVIFEYRPTHGGKPKDSKALFAAWAKIKAPSTGASEPIGGFAAGCLEGAVTIPSDGTGYAAMRLKRRRLFAHPEMAAYLEELGRKLHAMNQPLLLVGDVSPARGGPMATGHNSHQTGLDVDLWLRMSAKKPSRRQRETWSAPSFVLARKKLRSNWSATQAKLIAAAADFPSVNRVFVSPAIKRYFCDHMPTAPWLFKLRAWWGHEEHIHVRLSCPDNAAQCQSQPPLNSADSGCGAELDWWFSAEADDEWAKMRADKSPREFPDLPAACYSLQP
jgi:penicillin-insensitive murein endopeptidase